MPVPFVCPRCAASLRTVGGSFVCGIGHSFPVRNGIPRFAGGDGSYADAFGDQWNRFLRTQLDSYTGQPLSAERLRRCVGEAGWARLHAASAPARVLEVGCGAGRFTEILLKSAAHVTSVDLSSAVDANQKNFPLSAQHVIAQADVRFLPFAPGQFDCVVCLGVVQHTPNSEETIRALAAQVKPGGQLVVDHYTAGTLDALSTKPLFRAIFQRLPREKAFAYCETLVTLLLPIHRAVAPIPIVRSVFGRISPVYHFLHDSRVSRAVQREWAVLDTHDAMTDFYKHMRSCEQIRASLEALGLESIYAEYGGNGVEAHGYRPA